MKKLGLDKELNCIRTVFLLTLSLFIVAINNFEFKYFILLFLTLGYCILIIKHKGRQIEISLEDYLVFTGDILFVIISLILAGFWYSVIDIVFIVPLTMYVLQYGKAPGYFISAISLVMYFTMLICHQDDYLQMPRIIHSLFVVTIMVFLTYYVGTIRDVLIENINIDKMSKVYNKQYLLNRLKLYHQEFINNKFTYGLLILDIDKFKVVNDQKGHIAGDALIQEIASIIKRSVRKTDMVGRFGGDEFVVVVPSSEAELNIVKNRVEQELTDHLHKISRRWGLTVDLGVSVGSIHSCELIDKKISFEEMISMADNRMYNIKNNKKQGNIG